MKKLLLLTLCLFTIQKTSFGYDAKLLRVCINNFDNETEVMDGIDELLSKYVHDQIIAKIGQEFNQQVSIFDYIESIIEEHQYTYLTRDGLNRFVLHSGDIFFIEEQDKTVILDAYNTIMRLNRIAADWKGE